MGMGQFVQIYVTSNISEVIHRRSVDYLESKLNLVQTYLKQNIMWTSQTMVNRTTHFSKMFAQTCIGSVNECGSTTIWPGLHKPTKTRTDGMQTLQILVHTNNDIIKY